MRENLVLDLREAADKWRANHPAVMTFEIRYDLALCEAADAIEELQGRAKVLEKIADKWCDAATVKHGEWDAKNSCSVCGCQPWYERDIHFLRYCPNCGAKMDVGKDDE